MKTATSLMRSLLLCLVEEYGVQSVRSSLDEIEEDRRNEREGRLSLHERSGSIRPKSSKRMTAKNLVARARIDHESREILGAFAERFDQREILSSLADVREFLRMLGVDPGEPKDRVSAFKKIMSIVAEIPQAGLPKIISDAERFGPSELGLLSDAISERARSIKREGNGDS